MNGTNYLYSNYKPEQWLPTTVKEMQQRGWQQPDVIFFSGDAYIDHPSFGAAVISRVLEKLGLKVVIVPQPNWQDDLRDFRKFGEPRLFFAVSAGSMDSMVNHYTAGKRRRSDDAYTPGNRAGARPDYATTVYSNIIKKLYPHIPLVIGGIEASLRRFAHYDYWSDKLLPSVLIESKADMLIFGMGEKPIKQLVEQLVAGKTIDKIQNINQTAFLINSNCQPEVLNNVETKTLAPYNDCLTNKTKHAYNFKIIEEESNKLNSCRIIQKTNNYIVVANPGNPPLSQTEMDEVFALPFTRLPHPKYNNKGTIPAYEMIRHSINIHRGCFGGCSFCTISAHQGKFISSRSAKSIMNEVDQVTQMPDFKGYISDIGGPSANMWQMSGSDLTICAQCKRASCLFPRICPNLNTDHTKLTALYKLVSQHASVKKVFIGSGIRYDFIDKNQTTKAKFDEYLTQVIKHHVSGRLKVAPEHSSPQVLKLMRKPGFELFEELIKYFNKVNQQNGLNQQLIPYFISAHPQCMPIDMADLAIKTKKMDFKLEQVQDFTPTPMTLATVIYYSGIDPYTGQKVFTAKSKPEKEKQRSFFFWYKPDERQNITRELMQINRPDLIEQLFGKTIKNTNNKLQPSKTSYNKPKYKHKH